MTDDTDEDTPPLQRTRTPLFRLREIQEEDVDDEPLFFAGGAPFTRDVEGTLMSPVFSQAQIDALQKLRSTHPSPMTSMAFMALWLIGSIVLSIAVGIPMHSLWFVGLLAAGLPLAFALVFHRQKSYMRRNERAWEALWEGYEPVAVPDAFASDEAWETADQYF